MIKAFIFLLSSIQSSFSISISASSSPMLDFFNLLRFLLSWSRSSEIFTPISMLFISIVQQLYYHSAQWTLPAFSFSFLSVSASLICAWSCALISCIFLKFSTICLLQDTSLGIHIKRHCWWQATLLSLWWLRWRTTPARYTRCTPSYTGPYLIQDEITICNDRVRICCHTLLHLGFSAKLRI